MTAPYFDMRLGRMVQRGHSQVPPNPCRPGMPCAAQPALGQTSGAGKALIWIALIAAGGYGIYYLYKKSQDEDDFEIEAEEDEEEERDDESGYWVKLYNYPRGSRDRRLKSVEGPFETRSEAEEVAKQNEDVWYPAVAWSDESPMSQEK
jgi:hypothetical protein